jgi:DNA polymerase-3 subunit delta'
MQFKNIIGQEQIKNVLIKMSGNQRIAHALLFMEQPGSGALPLAVAFAQLLNCENPQSDDSCGICLSCKHYQKLSHPDLHFVLPVNSTDNIKKAKTDLFINKWQQAFLQDPYLSIQDWYDIIGIEKKQGLIAAEESSIIIHKLFLKNFEGKYKVLIMWHADKMNAATSNKLLKILEEPPDNTVFILITERYESILPTILSRTQLIKIPQPDNDVLTHYIKTHYQLEVNKAANIVRLSGNNINRIHELLGKESVSNQQESDFIEWMRMCWNMGKDYRKLMALIEDFSKQSRDMQRSFMFFALDTARECLISNMAGLRYSRFTEASFPGFEKFSKMIKPENIEPFTKALEEAAYHIERNANAKILFLDLSFKMHRILRM